MIDVVIGLLTGATLMYIASRLDERAKEKDDDKRKRN
jgi:hypothetical protein